MTCRSYHAKLLWFTKLNASPSRKCQPCYGLSSLSSDIMEGEMKVSKISPYEHVCKSICTNIREFNIRQSVTCFQSMTSSVVYAFMLMQTNIVIYTFWANRTNIFLTHLQINLPNDSCMFCSACSNNVHSLYI